MGRSESVRGGGLRISSVPSISKRIGPLSSYPGAPLYLFQHIDAVGQGFGFRVAVFYPSPAGRAQRAGVLVRPCLAKIHQELRARPASPRGPGRDRRSYRRAPDNGLRAIADFIGDNTFIDDNGFVRLFCRGSHPLCDRIHGSLDTPQAAQAPQSHTRLASGIRGYGASSPAVAGNQRPHLLFHRSRCPAGR